MRLFPRHGHTLALVSWDSFLDSLYEMCPSRFVGSVKWFMVEWEFELRTVEKCRFGRRRKVRLRYRTIHLYLCTVNYKHTSICI